MIRIVIPIRVCLKISNQGPVDPDPFFDHDPDRDENPEIKVRLKKENQSLPKNFQSESGCEKLTTSAYMQSGIPRRSMARGSHFSIKVWQKFYHQSPVENKKSKSG
ncbi:MAG: hypothetical protein WC586_09435 [Methanoregula sp.]